MLDLNQFAKEVYENSVNHGFWEDASIDRQIALIHTEWSEAVQSDRKGGCAEDVCTEMIDGVLRLLDCCGGYGIFLKFDEEPAAGKAQPIEFTANHLHYLTTQMRFQGFDKSAVTSMYASDAVWTVFCFVMARGLDPEQVLVKKHEYNRSRPYKHGRRY